MVKAVVAGAAGRMGKRVIQMIHQNPKIELFAAFERPNHPNIGSDAGKIAGLGAMGVDITPFDIEALLEKDVLIDFTTPEATLDNLYGAQGKDISIVIGTTGITGDMLREARSLVKQTRCVMAPNMSIGVNVMFKIAEEIAKILGDGYDIEILEIHHRLKKDAPSGTAMKLARILAEATGRDLEKVGVYERKGMIGERTADEIGIQTWRAGDITGEHTVMFGGIGERLELIHRAHNRDNFAKGAVRAALWIVKQPKGLYDMQDVLGLR
ncbi:MAG: 4-hydroxy-tetrahydrodipicolinate reductase [Patescibacteria group bacterium]